MIEFLQDYGLWIALAGVFFAMHRFGMGCCGGHRQRPVRRAQGPDDGNPEEKKTSGVAVKANDASH